MNFKQVLLLSIFVLPFVSYNQTTEFIDGNNIKALIADNGHFFRDNGSSTSYYEYPKDSNSFVAYGMSYWIGGKDINNQLKLAANSYGSSGSTDYFPGPIANDYNSSHYTSTYPSAIWKISRAEINYHVGNYTAAGYTPIPAIANWPGNGNTSEGIAAQLAPYVDVNNDQIYNPMDGDHPYIQGDQAVYTIMNDAAGFHTVSGGDPLGIEVHSMFYQFDSSDDINNTTFLNVKVINRSTAAYYDFLFGLWMDADIGLGSNDYIGCDTSRNIQYTYNGTASDGGGSGQNSYGLFPPAFGFKFLNNDMHASVYYDNGGGTVRGDPQTAPQFYQYMNALWLNGQHFTYGGLGDNGANPLTNYCFSGNPYTNTGWTEPGVGSPPADRRMMSSVGPMTIVSGQEICYDFAFIVNNDSANHLANVQNLLYTGDFVQDFYDNNIQPCSQIFLGQTELDEQLDLNIYPNPSNGSFTVQSNEAFEFNILDLNGKLIQTGQGFEGNNYLELEVEKGIYLIQIKTENSIETRKIEILK